MMTCRAGVSEEVPIARPTMIRLPVMTLVNVPPMVIKVTTSTHPLVNVSRPTRGTWRGRPAGAGRPGGSGRAGGLVTGPPELDAGRDQGDEQHRQRRPGPVQQQQP